jgi:2-polyprenyl-3-methyl-5-hydroxy-6-metoxy-1,4-benzoquinol methylase
MKTVDPLRQRHAMVGKLEQRIASEGKIKLPAVPAMLEDYTARCEQLFASLGRKLSAAERDQLQGNIESQLDKAFAASQRSNIIIAYEAAVSGLLNYVITPDHASIEATYEGWIHTRQAPYFGVEPDAKVMAVARESADPPNCAVLDIGAGTGRNALALARLGHPVDALEMTPKFADLLSKAAKEDKLNVRVICQDVFKSMGNLRRDYQMMLVSEVVSDFRSASELRELLRLAAECLKPGGKLVMNAFIAQAHYSEDDAVRQFAQQVYTCFFSKAELSSALVDLPLHLLSDESAYEYEKDHLPAGGWPPTPWYPEWTTGLDVFNMKAEDSPVNLRWLVLQKSGPNLAP